MEKIAINGAVHAEKIIEKYNTCEADFCFNVKARSISDCNEYSAVFFAGEYDESDMRAFIGTEHLRICRDEAELFSELDFFFGIPQRVEIERKFLVEYPDISLLQNDENCGFVEINQAYISSSGGNFRVRKRGRGDDFIYIHTIKKKLSDLVRAEMETRISQADYELLSRNAKVLSKVRWLIVYKNKYFELDVFPFWNDRALLEIELKSENEQFELPPFIKVIKEVTEDKAYRNFALCAKYGKQHIYNNKKGVF